MAQPEFDELTSAETALAMKLGLALVYGSLAIVVVLAGLLIVFFVVYAYVSCPPFPLDNVLIARFHSNEPAIQRVLSMSDEDKNLSRITSYPSNLNLSRNRCLLYRNLFDQIGLCCGISRNGNGDVYFIVASREDGEFRGYAYLRQEPKDPLRLEESYYHWNNNYSDASELN